MKKIIKIWELGIWLFLLAPISEACNVPVYQFALENWTTDDYVFLVFTADSSPATRPNALKFLETAAKDSLVNISLDFRSATDWDRTPSDVTATFPWMRVFYPHTPHWFWEGPVTPENVRNLLDSPARQTLVQRLVEGDAAVWLFLETGNPATDSIVARKLAKNLKMLSDSLKVPATSVDSAGNCVIHPDSAEISVRFSLLSIPANAPEESLFRQMLLGIEPDLLSISTTQPVAIPVFGRGRALYALIGSGVNEKLIRRACESIIGWCSCEVKADNPGMDLLIRSDWKFVTKLATHPTPALKLPPVTGLSRFVPVPITDSSAQSPANPGPDSTPLPPTAVAESVGPVPDVVLFPVLWIFLAGILVVAGITIFMLRRNQIKD